MSGKLLSPEFANMVYDILVLYGGANESMRGNFVYSHTDPDNICWEYRFSGLFGFGGKYWSERNAINYYAEDHTKKLDKRQAAINELLGGIK